MPPSLPPRDLLLAYAQAQASLARLEERLTLSPVRQPWRTRMALAERQALAAADAAAWTDEAVTIDARGRVSTSPYELTYWKGAIGQPITLDAIARDPGALLAWLGADQDGAAARDREALVAVVGCWSEACRRLPPSPPLLHSGRMAALWRQHAPLGRGDAVASLLIGDRWGPGRWKGSQGGLVALGLQHSRSPWKVARGNDVDHLWLDAVHAGATAHLEWEVLLRGYGQRAARRLAGRPRSERLKQVILLAMARPSITSAQISQALDLTSAGAIKLLTTAVHEGLLIERTGQASYRSYSVPIGAPTPRRLVRHRVDPFSPNSWEDDDDAEVSGSL